MHTMTLRLTLVLACAATVFAQEPPSVVKWPAHSMERPRPKVVAPEYDGLPVPAPAGAVVLFDGKDLAKWKQDVKKDATDPSDAPKWKLEDGYFQVVPGTGMMRTREAIKGSVHLHIEWATPSVVKGNSQGRGNSGVFLSGFPELQVLDSWENDTYPDGQAGAFYGVNPPLVNASRKPGEWQCYDLLVERAPAADGKPAGKTQVTVRHNNVLVQDHLPLGGAAQESTLAFQDHGNPIRFRNIWAAPIPDRKPGSGPEPQVPAGAKSGQ